MSQREEQPTLDLYVFMRDGNPMVLNGMDEKGLERRGPLLATDHAVANAFARDVTKQEGHRYSVYRLGSHTGDAAAEAGRVALDADDHANCAFFIEGYDAEAAQRGQSVLDGLDIRMEPYERRGSA